MEREEDEGPEKGRERQTTCHRRLSEDILMISPFAPLPDGTVTIHHERERREEESEYRSGQAKATGRIGAERKKGGRKTDLMNA